MLIAQLLGESVLIGGRETRAQEVDAVFFGVPGGLISLSHLDKLNLALLHLIDLLAQLRLHVVADTLHMFNDSCEIAAYQLHLVILVILNAFLTGLQVGHVLLAQLDLSIYLFFQFVRKLLQLLHLLEVSVRSRYLVRLEAYCKPRRVLDGAIEVRLVLLGLRLVRFLG